MIPTVVRGHLARPGSPAEGYLGEDPRPLHPVESFDPGPGRA